MAGNAKWHLSLAWWVLGACCLAGTGCLGRPHCQAPGGAALPRELCKVSLPPYVIEPPDVLLIDALRVVPLPPYRIEPFDVLLVGFQPQSVPMDLPPELVIQPNTFTVEPDGTVQLGPQYGSVRVMGLTLDEARTEVEKRVRKVVKKEFADAIKIVLELAQSQGLQQVTGEHLVRPDGTVSLGTYGEVHVAGITLAEAKAKIEAQLSQFLLNPQVTVDVFGYNSKTYYVIMELGSSGQQIIRLPVTGNETVLDAVAQINGLPAFSTRHHIWVARPGGDATGCDQILPVDWRGIVKKGNVTTNYQLFPGDRVYVHMDTLWGIDDFLTKLFAPVERVFGVILLGDSVIGQLQVGPNAAFGTGFGAGFGTGFVP